MLHGTISIDEVIGRVIRNTRIQDSSYIQDMNEWIPEAMGFMRTRMARKYAFKDIQVVFHKGKLPCGLLDLMAVEHNGHRMRFSNTVRGSQAPTHRYSTDGLDLFVSTVEPQNQAAYDGPQNTIWKSNAVPFCDTANAVMNCSVNHNEHYTLELGYINTSVCDTWIRLHYLIQPLDENGLPLIPDNEDYKEAIYYYIRSKMIGCGFKDSTYAEKDLQERFEKHAARAIAQIRYPSTDMMEARKATMLAFNPPENYWNSFFGLQDQYNGYVGPSGMTPCTQCNNSPCTCNP